MRDALPGSAWSGARKKDASAAWLSAAIAAATFAYAAAAQPGVPAARANDPRPKQAPRVFVTHNYQLAARIPAGLFHCPFPATHVGADHGVALYLTAPTACDLTAPVAADGVSDGLPVLRILYAYNVGDVVEAPNGPRPAVTDSELAQQECGTRPAALPDGLALLGRKATGCVRRDGRRVRVTLVSLYAQERRPDAGPPDSQVFVTLDTDVARLGRDVAVLRRIAGSLRVCRGLDRPPVPGRPDCPARPAW